MQQANAQPVENWLRPGFLSLAIPEYGATVEGKRDLLDVVTTGFAWAAQLGSSWSAKCVEELDQVQSAMSLPALFENLHACNEALREEGLSLTQRVCQKVLSLLRSVAETLMFFGSTGVNSLKGSVQWLKGVFWGCGVLVGGLSLSSDVQAARLLRKEIGVGLEGKEGVLKEHQLNVAYLNVARGVIGIVAATLMLLSALFVEAAIVIPELLLLGLGTTWLALNFSSYFYEKLVIVKA